MESLPSVMLLKANNWQLWKQEMKVLLMHFGSWTFVNPEVTTDGNSTVTPTDEATTDEKTVTKSGGSSGASDSLEKESFHQQLRKSRAYTLIYQALSPEFKPLISSTTDGREAWTILCRYFEPTTRAHVIGLLDEFFNVRCEPDEDVGLFLCRVKQAAAKLQEAGHTVAPLYEGYQMIRSLPTEFQPIVQNIYRWSDNDFVPSKIEAEIVLENDRLKMSRLDCREDSKVGVFFNTCKPAVKTKGKISKCSNPNVNSDSNNVNPTSRKLGPCFKCGLYGHLKINCKRKVFKNNYNKKVVKRNVENSNIEVSNIDRDFIESECCLIEISSNHCEANSSFVNDNTHWVFDTGATAHFCNNKDLFLDFKPVADMQMSLAVGEKESPVMGKGTVQLAVVYKGKLNRVTLANVYYNPNLRRNLLSGVMLEKAGASFYGNKGKVIVYDRDGEELFYAVRKNDLYFFKPSRYFSKSSDKPQQPSANQVVNINKNNVGEIWHERFCHINSEYVLETSKNNSVKGIPTLTKLAEDCISCRLAKSKRVSFKPIGKIRSKRPLELLHLDVCGPLSVQTQGGRRYFLTIIDDYSRKVTVFPLRQKSEVFQMFIKFQRRAERFLGNKIVSIRTDGGTEFCNREFNSHFEKEGISHEVTNPYSPEMNGVAERYNLTALDGIKSMLNSSGLPQKYWGEALFCFTYVWNRVCHKGYKKTPFELYTGRKPSVSHLKRFGCLAFVGVPKQNRKKLDMRAKLGIMFGYAQRTKGYRIWLPEESKLIETINVRFDENKKGVEVLNKSDSELVKNISFSIPGFYEDDIFSSSEHEDCSKSEIKEVKDKGGETSDKNIEDQSDLENDLIPCSTINWIRKTVPRKDNSRTDIYYGIEGIDKLNLRTLKEIENYCRKHNIQYDNRLFNFSGKNTSSGRVSDIVNIEANLTEIKIPRNYKEAINSPESLKWREAMNQEMDVMYKRKVWDLVNPPENVKILGNRWVFTVKRNEKNEIVRFKGRLVAQGFDQVKGESYDEVYSPVVNFSIIRLFFTIFVCMFKWFNLQIDINNAYLYADLNEKIYMKQPEGFEQDKSKVCMLNKALYGLHQSARQWFFEIDEVLIKLNFVKLNWCNCVYSLQSKIILLLYVDDIVIFAETEKDLQNALCLLQKHFDLKVLGKTKKLLGIEFEENNGRYFIHQRTYIEKVCQMFESFKYPIKSLPIPKGEVFSKLDSPLDESELNEMSKLPYRNLIGCLAFIASRTRPDIMYAVNLFSQFQSCPGIKHWNGLLKLLGYLKYTMNYKLELSKIENLNLNCYSDSDFAANRDDRVSIGGYILFLDKTPVSWRTFKQKCISLSTMEAEYVSLTEAAKELVWIKNVLENKCLNLNLKDSILYCDNQAAISFSNSAFENHRTKHIHIRYHFLRNLVYEKIFNLKYVKSSDNLADIMTKPLVKDQLIKFCKEIFELNFGGILV